MSPFLLFPVGPVHESLQFYHMKLFNLRVYFHQIKLAILLPSQKTVLYQTRFLVL
jgi:hypothetical protein